MVIKELAPTAAESFGAIRRQRAATREYIAGRRTTLAAGCSADIVLSVAQHCRDVLAVFDQHASTAGLVAFARTQYGDAAYDMVAEYHELRAALVALRDGIVQMFPQEPGALGQRHD